MTDAEKFRAFRFALDPTAAQRQDLDPVRRHPELAAPSGTPLMAAFINAAWCYSGNAAGRGLAGP